MSTKTISQRGQGFGSNPVSIVSSIDGQQVFAGTVPTLDQPVVIGLDSTPQIFTWTVPISFAGTQSLSIDVTGGDLVLTFTGGDFAPMDGPSTRGPGIYTVLYHQTIGEVTVPDPFVDVVIDGKPMSRSAEPDGQWHWYIPEGTNFSATVNITQGLDYPEWQESRKYPENGCVTNAGQIYKALQTVPRNTAITDTVYWQLQS
jgi:hypothetical protein